MVRMRPRLRSMTIPVPSRSAPRVSAVRASSTALMLSLTTAAAASAPLSIPGGSVYAARHEASAAVKKGSGMGLRQGLVKHGDHFDLLDTAGWREPDEIAGLLSEQRFRDGRDPAHPAAARIDFIHADDADRML